MRLAEALGPSHRYLAISAVLLGIAVVLGGGGSPNPSTEFWLELLAGIAALSWIWLTPSLRMPRDWMLWLVAALVVAIPFLQLVPLPPALWQALPGRDAEVAALSLVGAEQSWRPLSTSPARTLASLLSVVPPLLLMLGVGALGVRDRRWIIGAVGLLALISAVLGAMQLAGGGNAFKLYQASNPFVVTGFHANRNAAVDVMLIGMLALATFVAGLARQGRAAVKGGSRNRMAWFAGGVILLALAGVMTASRTGIVLMIPVLVGCWLIVAPALAASWHRLIRWTIVGGVAVLVVCGVLLSSIPALAPVAARFSQTSEGRPDLWHDTIFAIGQYMPFGSGVGTFVPTFIALEPLEAVNHSAPNRAHNDFLELALEAGLFGIAALALIAAVVTYMAVRRWRQRDEGSRPQVIFALGTLAVIAAHSLVDYPMRSIALASLAALAAATLATPNEARSLGGAVPASSRRRVRLTQLALTIPLLAYLFAAWGNGLDRQSVFNPPLESSVPAAFRAAADRSAAAMALARGQSRQGLAYAERALHADPMNPQAASLLGSARQLTGDNAGAEAAFRVAAQGGWRDTLTQLYWYDAAVNAGDLERAALRLDAFLRAEPGFPAAGALLELLEVDDAGRGALARRLANEPNWAKIYFDLDYANAPALVQVRADVARKIAADGTKLGCTLPRRLTVALIERGMRREAADIWTAHCGGQVPATGLSDGGFDALANDAGGSPFGWTRNSGGDVSVESIDAAGTGKAIRARSGASVTRWIVSQPLNLAPGRYRLRADVGPDSPAAAGRVVASLDCDGRKRLPGTTSGDLAKTGQIVAVEACQRLVLALWLRPGTDDVTIDNLKVEPLQ